MKCLRTFLLVLFAAALPAYAGEAPRPAAGEQRGTGDLGIVIERASGSVLIIDTSQRRVISRVEGLGDLSHASAVFSSDARFAYVFGRDGGLTKIDLLTSTIAHRVIQAKAHPQNFLLPRRQILHDLANLVFQQSPGGLLRGREYFVILNEIAQKRVLLVFPHRLL